MSPPRTDSVVRLHVITGKGGTGKTTVAAAFALMLAARGQRVLVAEVEGRQGLAQVFDVPPLGPDEERTVLTDPSGGEVVALAVDAKAALLEYLQRFYRLGRAGSVLQKVGAVDFATTIAPGVRDVLLIGKVYEAVGRQTKGGRRRPVYDAVALDAPPTGRIGRFLAVNSEVSEVAKVGPIRSQADSITALLTSPATRVHVVTLLEEMPVQETADAIEELRGLSLRVGSVVASMVRQPTEIDEHVDGHQDHYGAPAIPDGDLPDTIRDDLERGLAEAGIEANDAMVDGLLAEVADHRRRLRLQEEQAGVLARLGVPVRRVPMLADDIADGGVRVVADLLEDEGGL